MVSGLLVALGFGEADALVLESLECVIYPEVGSHKEGFCVKIVEGVLAILRHSTPLISYVCYRCQVANEGLC